MTTLMGSTASYLGETTGAFTLFMSAGTIAECVDYFTHEKSPLSAAAQKISYGAASAIAWPWLLSDALELTWDRSIPVFLSLTENIAAAMEYLNENQLVDCAAYLPAVSTGAYGSSVVADGIRVYDELNVYFAPEGSEAKKKLALIRIAEKVASIGRAILGLCAILWGIVAAPQLRLFLTVSWLIARTTNHLYEKNMVL